MSEVVAATREAALAAVNKERRRTGFQMKPWGGMIYVCALTGDESEALARETVRRARARKRDKSVFVRVVPRALLATVHSVDGQKFFKPEDENELSEQEPNLPKQLIKIALEMAGLTEDEAEELEGN